MELSLNLEQALARMRFVLEPGEFCLLGFSDPPSSEDLAELSQPSQLVLEQGETSILVAAGPAQAILARHPAAQVEGGLRWIRFEAPMGWELVGFLAKVTGELAAAGVPIGAVCGYSRDHLFVAGKHLELAREVLGRLFPEQPA